MIALEQTLQDLHIAEQDTAFGKTWHSLSVPEIERIKEVFLGAGFKPPESLGEMVIPRIIYDRFTGLLSTSPDHLTKAEISQLVAVACGVENE